MFPFAPKRKYTPCDAPKEKLFALRDFLGFEKNVIVQATCHDTDNRALVDALKAANGQAKGVAFLGEEVTEAELKELITFYRSPIGKKLVTELPAAVEESRPRVLEWGTKTSDEFIAALRAEMKKRGYTI